VQIIYVILVLVDVALWSVDRLLQGIALISHVRPSVLPTFFSV